MSSTPLHLKNLTRDLVLASHVEVAKTLWARGKGLLGRSFLPEGHCLWIHQCRSIHTYFMQFNIDVIFVDRHLKVTAVKTNLTQWRLAWGGFCADSCFEFPAHSLNNLNVQKGDLLYVGN